MTFRPEEWARIKTVFDAALALPDAARPAYLAQACDGDGELRRHVEGLLDSHARADAFLETPVLPLVDESAGGNLEGQRLGPYLLSARIGAGGMGEVYKARDTRLDRTVAIKVLPGALARDRAAKERLEREARAVAALNHPNICALYDIGGTGDDDGIEFLVMEFVDGGTLASRLAAGPLPVETAIRSAIEIASALDKAHQAGIVHRDLKPNNIMLSKAGVKLLDFGLAKTFAPVAFPAEGRDADLTLPGSILGTLHYMSPEQLEGKPVDRRTDLFAFGGVLYEMLTGKKAFDAGSSVGVVTAIMASDPTPVRQLAPLVPASLEYVIARCLAKDPDDRWQTARDMLAELKRNSDTAGHVIDTPRPGRRRSVRLATAVASVATIAVVVLTSLLLLRSPAPPPVLRLSVLPPPGGFDLSPDPIVSPDGRYIAFKAQNASHQTSIWLKAFDSAAAKPIPGTEGTDYTFAPFWSPDSRSIGFFASGKLKRIDVTGGAAQVLASAPEPRGGTWSVNGTILYNGDTQNLFRVPAAGGVAPVKASPTGEVRLFPYALPDGHHYLFTSRNAKGLGQGVYVASLDSDEVRRISDAWSPARYAHGHLLFVRQTALFAQPFDLSSLTLHGEPKQIADQVGIGYGNPLSFPFSSSETGTLAFWTGNATRLSQLTWYDRSGAKMATTGEPAVHYGFTLSPDGRRAALERQDPSTNTIDIWLMDVTNSAGPSRLTLDGRSSSPLWAPDGSRLVVTQRGEGLVTMPVRGPAGRNITVADASSTKWVTDWSTDGRLIAFIDSVPEGWRLWTAELPGGQPRIYRQGPFALAQMQFSPDSRWVAYQSDESGRPEVYVDSYPNPGDRIRVSIEGGGWPKWRRDGRELYYLSRDRRLMVVGIKASPSMVVSPPRALFETPAMNPDTSRSQYAPDGTGSRFLFNAPVESREPVGISLVSNWPALLQDR